jgi:hypothetical protein
MWKRISSWLRRVSTGWVALSALVIFLLFSALVRRPMNSSTCSDHAVHPSERSDASKIIVHQLVGMGKGESVLRRDSPSSSSR